MSGPREGTATLSYRSGGQGYRAYGLSPTFERVIPMLSLRSKSGSVRALPYFALSRADFDPSLGRIELVFGEVLAEIVGRNLAALFEQLCDHAVVWVEEADAPTAALLPSSAPVVERLKTGTIR